MPGGLIRPKIRSRERRLRGQLSHCRRAQGSSRHRPRLQCLGVATSVLVVGKGRNQVSTWPCPLRARLIKSAEVVQFEYEVPPVKHMSYCLNVTHELAADGHTNFSVARLAIWDVRSARSVCASSCGDVASDRSGFRRGNLGWVKPSAGTACDRTLWAVEEASRHPQFFPRRSQRLGLFAPFLQKWLRVGRITLDT